MPPVVTNATSREFLFFHAWMQISLWATVGESWPRLRKTDGLKWKTTEYGVSSALLHVNSAVLYHKPQICCCIPLVSSGSTMGGMRSGSSSSPACSPVARNRLRSRKSGTSIAKSTDDTTGLIMNGSIRLYSAMKVDSVFSFLRTQLHFSSTGYNLD